MADIFYSTDDLRKRWAIDAKDGRAAVCKMAKRYKHILQPIKIGNELRFKPECVEKFEEQRRVYCHRETEESYES